MFLFDICKKPIDIIKFIIAAGVGWKISVCLIDITPLCGKHIQNSFKNNSARRCDDSPMNSVTIRTLRTWRALKIFHTYIIQQKLHSTT